MTTSKPIYIGTFNGKPLRFFKSPHPGPQFPWHSQDDLYKCLGLDHGARSVLRNMTAQNWGDDVRIVDTENGIVTIAPHCMAQGLIGAVATAGRVFGKVSKTEDQLEAEYCVEVAKAGHVLTAGMSDQESMEYVLAAARNQEDLRGGPKAANR